MGIGGTYYNNRGFDPEGEWQGRAEMALNQALEDLQRSINPEMLRDSQQWDVLVKLLALRAQQYQEMPEEFARMRAEMMVQKNFGPFESRTREFRTGPDQPLQTEQGMFPRY